MLSRVNFVKGPGTVPKLPLVHVRNSPVPDLLTEYNDRFIQVCPTIRPTLSGTIAPVIADRFVRVLPTSA